jgi:OOP family OmpA-OmpF porin
MRTILAVSLLGLSSAAVAEEGFAPDWYAGLGIGEIMISESQAGLSFEGEDTAWQVLMGYRFTPYASMEAGYISGGEVNDVVLGLPVSVKTESFFGSVVGTLPLSETFGVHGRVGMLRWDADLSAPGARADDSGTDLLWGGGMSLRANDVLFRFDYQRADIEVTDAEFLTLSVMILI